MSSECRNCHRPQGSRHTTRCPNRGTPRNHAPGFVLERHCIISTFAEGREIATKLVQIKARLGQLRLFKTMHALDAATHAIGYELAEHSTR